MRFAVVSGAAGLSCGAGTSCTVTTNAAGQAQISLTGAAVAAGGCAGSFGGVRGSTNTTRTSKHATTSENRTSVFIGLAESRI